MFNTPRRKQAKAFGRLCCILAFNNNNYWKQIRAFSLSGLPGGRRSRGYSRNLVSYCILTFLVWLKKKTVFILGNFWQDWYKYTQTEVFITSVPLTTWLSIYFLQQRRDVIKLFRQSNEMTGVLTAARPQSGIKDALADPPVLAFCSVTFPVTSRWPMGTNDALPIQLWPAGRTAAH